MIKRYIKRARFASNLLKNIPFLRMVAVNGSVASGEIKESSDIDFFIVCQKKRLWFGRFLATLILEACFLRAKKNKHAGKICLNHFLATDSLISRRDSYNAYQYSHLLVLYDADKTFEKFLQKNAWMAKFYPINSHHQLSHSTPSQRVKFFLEQRLAGWLGNFLERQCRNWQLKRINQHHFYHQQDSALSVSDQEFYYYTGVSRKYKLWGKSAEKF